MLDRFIKKYKEGGISGVGRAVVDDLVAFPTTFPRTKTGVKLGFTPRLRGIGIELSNCCNLRCKMCPAQTESKRKRGLMEWDMYIKIVDEISQMQDISLGLNFAGESLLHPQFIRMLEYASGKGISSIGLNTNGDLLTAGIIEAFIRFCKDGILGVSMDGSEETHERIRKGSRYSVVAGNVKAFLKQRRKKGVDSPGIKINLTKAGQSKTEIDNFVKEWTETVDIVQVNEQLDSSQRVVTENSCLAQFSSSSSRLPCSDLWSYMAILWNGDVTLCCHDLMGNGSIKENVAASKIWEIWKGKEYRRIRLAHLNGRFEDVPLCRYCEAWPKHYIERYERKDNLMVRHKGVYTLYMRDNTNFERKSFHVSIE